MNEFECVLKSGFKFKGKYVKCRVAKTDVPKNHYRYSVSYAENINTPTLIEPYARTNHLYDIVTTIDLEPELQDCDPEVCFAEIESFELL